MIVHYFNKKLIKIFFISVSFIMLSAVSTQEYTSKVDPLPNMPKGNPDLSLGIVVHENSTGIDVLADSSQNIRFSAMKNFEKTHIEKLSSSSMVDRSPKKFKFMDEKHSFSSDNIYEFKIMFNDEDHQWKYISFMPFPSVIEWVTEDKVMIYLEKWVKTFENAGWKRMEYQKSKNLHRVKNYTLPMQKYNAYWMTKDYKVNFRISLREPSGYKYYIPKAERKNLKTSPEGYIVFVNITKNSAFSD